jgi:hypothetical protein
VATNPKSIDSSPTIEETEDFDAVLVHVLDGARERIHADMDRARKLGIIDEYGGLISKELPPDMQPGAQRDFGG